MPHELSFEDLVDYMEGRLTPAEAAHTEAHIRAGCAQCAADVAWLQRTLGLMAGDQLADAPERAVRRAQAVYRAKPRRRAIGAALASLWRRVQAPRLRPVVSAVLVVLMVVGGTWAWGETTVAQAATLSEVQGPVEVRLPGAADWQPAVAGEALSAGYAVRAGEGGWAVIVYADGSRSCLAERAEVELVELSGRRNRERTTIRLNQAAGHTQHQLASPASSLQVRSGDTEVEASAAIYDVWVSDGEVDVVASRGKVTVKNGGGKAGLDEGEQGHAGQGKVEVSTPEPATPTAEHGKGKPQATPQADAPGKDKPERMLEPLPITPAEDAHVPPGQSKAKEPKAKKDKVPRVRWPWSREDGS